MLSVTKDITQQKLNEKALNENILNYTAPASAPALVATPEPKKPAIVNLASTELFEFNSAVLAPDARARLDSQEGAA